MFDPQTKKFCAAVTDALPELPEEAMQSWIGNPKGLQKVLRDGLCPPTLEPSLDFTVRVNHAEPLPQGFNEMHPSLTGPTEFDLRHDVEPWSFPGQGLEGGVVANAIYSYLLGEDLLYREFGFAELMALARASSVARMFRERKTFFGWRSVSEKSGDFKTGLLVPCLTVPSLSGSQPNVRWFSVKNVILESSDLNLRFRRPFVQTE